MPFFEKFHPFKDPITSFNQSSLMAPTSSLVIDSHHSMPHSGLNQLLDESAAPQQTYSFNLSDSDISLFGDIEVDSQSEIAHFNVSLTISLFNETLALDENLDMNVALPSNFFEGDSGFNFVPLLNLPQMTIARSSRCCSIRPVILSRFP
ncbi:hypothetical protein M422DRAFT_44639 [Sphaerobolus stellatus SS14]|nr:hypothetical protein M422DRAFT_44639 [Sphaerobolus stellatus SS14]